MTLIFVVFPEPLRLEYICASAEDYPNFRPNAAERVIIQDTIKGLTERLDDPDFEQWMKTSSHPFATPAERKKSAFFKV
jgi:hypothetical protein